MTIEEVKEYLNGAYYIDKRIDVLQDELALLESKLYKCTATYGSTGHNSSPQPTFEYTIDRVMQYRDRLNIEIDNLVDKKKEIKSIIYKLEDNKAKLIMEYKYINYLPFETIADRLNYSKRQVLRLHKNSLENLSKML